MATKFATVAFIHRESGSYIEGEFVLESSNAWQVAVGGKVQALIKDEWMSTEPRKPNTGFEGLFGDIFGSRQTPFG